MLIASVATAYNVQYALWLMGQGMLGIFLFMGSFYLLIYLLEKLFKPKEQKL